MGELKLSLPWPPSLNTLYPTGRDGRRHLSKRGKDYKREVWAAVVQQLGNYKPLAGDLKITTHLWPPDKKRRDEDNLHKAIRDALTYCNVIGDDCQFRESHNYLNSPAPGGRCEISIQALGKAE